MEPRALGILSKMERSQGILIRNTKILVRYDGNIYILKNGYVTTEV